MLLFWVCCVGMFISYTTAVVDPRMLLNYISNCREISIKLDCLLILLPAARKRRSSAVGQRASPSQSALTGEAMFLLDGRRSVCCGSNGIHDVPCSASDMVGCVENDPRRCCREAPELCPVGSVLGFRCRAFLCSIKIFKYYIIKKS